MGCGENPNKGAIIKSTPTKLPTLTIGIPVYDEFREAQITIEALIHMHGHIMHRAEKILVDNNPNGKYRTAYENFCRSTGFIYVPLESPVGTTAPRDEIFKRATGEVTFVMDAHVIVIHHVFQRLLEWAAAHPDDMNLWQGPMLDDNPNQIHGSHFDDVWGTDHSWGQWAVDDRVKNLNGEPFAVRAQGLGVVACRTKAWLPSPPGLTGFSCDEGMIHEQFRQAGRQCLIFPWLRWWHCFRRDEDPAPYPPTSMDTRYENYVRRFRQLGLDESPLERFRPLIGDANFKRISSSVAVPRFLPEKATQSTVKSPNLFAKAWTFAKSMWKWRKAGFTTVPEPVYLRRLEICMKCDHQAAGECRKCGCPVDKKAVVATEECPDDPPRWPTLQVASSGTNERQLAPVTTMGTRHNQPFNTNSHKRPECSHSDFAAHVNLDTTRDKNGRVMSYTVRTDIKCNLCGVVFTPAVARTQPT